MPIIFMLQFSVFRKSFMYIAIFKTSHGFPDAKQNYPHISHRQKPTKIYMWTDLNSTHTPHSHWPGIRIRTSVGHIAAIWCKDSRTPVLVAHRLLLFLYNRNGIRSGIWCCIEESTTCHTFFSGFPRHNGNGITNEENTFSTFRCGIWCEPNYVIIIWLSDVRCAMLLLFSYLSFETNLWVYMLCLWCMWRAMTANQSDQEMISKPSYNFQTSLIRLCEHLSPRPFHLNLLIWALSKFAHLAINFALLVEGWNETAGWTISGRENIVI